MPDFGYHIGRVFYKIEVGVILILAAACVGAVAHAWLLGLLACWHAQHHYVLWTVGYALITSYVVGAVGTNIDEA